MSAVKDKADDTVITRELIVANKVGIHARPAAMFVKIASRYTCDIFLEKDGERINGKSIMGLLMLAAGPGSRLTLAVSGKDDILDRHATNLSDGGMFIRDPTPPPVGSLVLLEFVLPSGEPLLRISARVVHARPATVTAWERGRASRSRRDRPWVRRCPTIRGRSSSHRRRSRRGRSPA